MDNIGSESSQKLQKPWFEVATLKKFAEQFDTSTNKIREVIKFLIDFGVRKGDIPIDFYANAKIVDYDIFFKRIRAIENPETYAFLERVRGKDKKTADTLAEEFKRDRILILNAILLQLASGGHIFINAEIFENLLKQEHLTPEIFENLLEQIYLLHEKIENLLEQEYLLHERMLREIYHLEEE